MSFILDALRKSENERRRQGGPVLYEVQAALPRPRLPAWMVVLAALLAVNLALLTWLALRNNAARSSAQQAGQFPQIPAPPQPQNPAATQPSAGPGAGSQLPSPAPSQSPLQNPSQNAPQAVVQGGAGSPAPSVPAASAVVSPDAAAHADTAGERTPATAPAAPQLPTAGDEDVPGRNAAAARADDDAPAVEPRTAEPTIIRATANGLPSYQQLAGAPGAQLPDLRLNLNAYSASPADRFVYINMNRMGEGDTTPQGVRVETIMPDGVILSFQGQRFVLQGQ